MAEEETVGHYPLPLGPRVKDEESCLLVTPGVPFSLHPSARQLPKTDEDTVVHHQSHDWKVEH